MRRGLRARAAGRRIRRACGCPGRAPAFRAGALVRPRECPFIPIPEIDTEPHSGLTLGVIPTWLRTNTHDEIERIIAPDIIHSIIYDGFVSRALGSSVSYSFFGAEARYCWAFGPDVTLAWHAAARYMPAAGNAPFWALSSLGGDRSVTAEREPLRGYGADRFIDRNMFATGMELRTRVASLIAFGTHLSLEVAPFVDAGKVFADLGASPFSKLHATPGFGVRGVASPFVVGYVDIGFAHGKAAVFSGIDYPF